MGRTRLKNKNLPKYVILYHGAFYYRGPATQWKRRHLGRVFADAMREYGNLYRETGFSLFSEVCDKYEMLVMPQKAEATQASNRFELARIRKVFGNMRPGDIQPTDCYAFRDAVATQSGLVQANNTLALLKHLCVKSIEWGAMAAHPARDVKKLPVESRTRLPTRIEFDLVYQNATPMVRCAMDLAELTSMDRGSLLALPMRDCKLDGDGITYVRPKTKRRAARIILIEWSDELRAVVKRAKAITPQFRTTLIANRSGKPFTASGFSTMWQKALVRTEEAAAKDGIEFERFHFHDIRAMSISESDDLLEASQRAGHASTEITQRVYRRKPARVRPLR